MPIHCYPRGGVVLLSVGLDVQFTFTIYHITGILVSRESKIQLQELILVALSWVLKLVLVELDYLIINIISYFLYKSMDKVPNHWY